MSKKIKNKKLNVQLQTAKKEEKKFIFDLFKADSKKEFGLEDLLQISVICRKCQKGIEIIEEEIAIPMRQGDGKIVNQMQKIERFEFENEPEIIFNTLQSRIIKKEFEKTKKWPLQYENVPVIMEKKLRGEEINYDDYDPDELMDDDGGDDEETDKNEDKQEK